MERWFRSFKYEWMLKGGYSSLDEAKEDIKHYVFYYNRVRPHSYNQGLPPVLAKNLLGTADLVDHYNFHKTFLLKITIPIKKSA